MPRLLIVIASTRPGRVGPAVARWFEDLARRDGRFEIDVADLAEQALPLLDEPEHPRLGRYRHEHTRRWSARVAAADAFVFVMPEYNYGYTAPLKNALDYLSQEWRHKPVGLVSYGGIAGGTRAQQLLKPVLLALRLTVAGESFGIPFVQRHVEDGAFHPDEAASRSASALLDELALLTPVLAGLRG
jgi:NAD(P)H-dependent FMN reductase